MTAADRLRALPDPRMGVYQMTYGRYRKDLTEDEYALLCAAPALAELLAFDGSEDEARCVFNGQIKPGYPQTCREGMWDDEEDWCRACRRARLVAAVEAALGGEG